MFLPTAINQQNKNARYKQATQTSKTPKSKAATYGEELSPSHLQNQGPILSAWGRLVSPTSRERPPGPDPAPPETGFVSTSGGSAGIDAHRGEGFAGTWERCGRGWQDAFTSPCRARSDGPPTHAGWPGPKRQVLVVRQRRESDTPSPFHPVQTVVPRDTEAVAES